MSHRTKNRPPPPDPVGLPVIFFLLAVFVGVAPAYILSHFVFLYGVAYANVAWPTFMILLPLIAIALLASPRGKLWRSRMTVARLPHAFGWAFIIAALAGSIVVSPFGYLAVFNEMAGKDVTLTAKVLRVWDDVPRPGSRKEVRCIRHATILVAGHTKGMCLMDHYPSNDNIQGEDVLLQVRQSPFGFSIGQMALSRTP